MKFEQFIRNLEHNTLGCYSKIGKRQENWKNAIKLAWMNSFLLSIYIYISHTLGKICEKVERRFRVTRFAF